MNKTGNLFNINNESNSGERVADATTRFNSHPSNNPNNSFFEPCDNMLTYGFNKGRIEIEQNGLHCNYIFTNNALTDNLPTFERLEEILSKAGSSISAKKGVSICGMGLEVFALECRPTKNSTIICEIIIVRDGLIYGGKWYFDGQHNEIRWNIFKPKSTKEENKFEIRYYNCATLSKLQIDVIKNKLCDKLYYLNHAFDLTFIWYGVETKLFPADVLYKSILVGTPNYIKRDFTFEIEKGVNEDITFEFANTYDIIKNSKGNHVDNKTTKAEPKLSGVALIYGEHVTVCRGDDSWRIIERKSGHSTLNHVRCNIHIGEYLFNQFHRESQVKNKTNVQLTHLVDKYGQKLVFVDKETGERLSADDLKKWISKILCNYETDKQSEIEKKHFVEMISSYDIQTKNLLKEIFEPHKDSNFKIKSLWEIIEKECNEPCLVNVS